MSSAAAAAASAHVLSYPAVDCVTLSDAQRRAAPMVRPSEEDDGTGRQASLLASFVYPLSVDHFRQHIWKQKALHIQWRDPATATAATATAATESSSDKSAAGSKRKRGTSNGTVAAAASAAAHKSSSAGFDRFAYVKKEHLSNLTIQSLLEETASDNIFVWMKPKAAVATPSSAAAASSTALASFELDASNPAHLTAAQTLYAAGASLYFRSPPSMVAEYVTAFSADTGLNFAGVYPDGSEGAAAGSGSGPTPKGEIEVFLSRAGHVTDWHADFQENFTFQLAGSKTWHLKKGPVAHPLRGITPHYSNTDVEEQQVKVHSLTDPGFAWGNRPRTREQPAAKPKDEQESYDTVVLRPGDCFFHPAGLYHRVECSEDSVSVNISLISTDWASLVTDGLKQRLWCDDGWRAGISNVQSVAGARSYLTHRLDSLRKTVQELRAENFLPAALFLPRQTHYSLLNHKYDDSTCRALCAQALLVEADDGAESDAPAVKRPGKKQKIAAVAASDAAAASAASSPSLAPLLISALSGSTRFRVNPLGLLLRFDHGKKAREAKAAEQATKEQRAANGEESEEEVEEEEEETEEEEGGESALPDDGESKVGYVLHFIFGNDSLDSAVRVTADVSEPVAAAMEAARALSAPASSEKREQFSLDELVALAASKGAAGSKATGKVTPHVQNACRTVAFWLCQQGLLHLAH